VVRRQPAVAPPEVLHTDFGDLPEHVVVLDERLLHPLRERHPLQTVFTVQKIIYADLLAWRANAEQAPSTSYLCCLDFRFVDLDVVG